MKDLLSYEKKSVSMLKEVLKDRDSFLKVYAKGNSMRPIIKQGDILVIKPATSKDVHTGDIVVFEIGQSLCCHRLIMKYFKENHFIFVTKSDKTLMVDLPFGYKDLIGKVIRIEKGRTSLILESFFWRILNRLYGLYYLFILFARRRLRPLKVNLSKLKKHLASF